MWDQSRGLTSAPSLPVLVTYAVTDFNGIYELLVFQVVESQFETCPEDGGGVGVEEHTLVTGEPSGSLNCQDAGLGF